MFVSSIKIVSRSLRRTKNASIFHRMNSILCNLFGVKHCLRICDTCTVFILRQFFKLKLYAYKLWCATQSSVAWTVHIHLFWFFFQNRSFSFAFNRLNFRFQAIQLLSGDGIETTIFAWIQREKIKVHNQKFGTHQKVKRSSKVDPFHTHTHIWH